MAIIKEHFHDIINMNESGKGEPDYVIKDTTCVLRFKNSKEFEKPANVAQLFNEAAKDFPRIRMKDVNINYQDKRLEVRANPPVAYKRHGTDNIVGPAG